MFSSPKQVVASSPSTHMSSSTHKMPENVPVGCVRGGCVEQHGTCETHCVSPSRQTSRSVGVMSANSEYVQICGGLSLGIPRESEDANYCRKRTLAPPKHLLLRSIVKRE